MGGMSFYKHRPKTSKLDKELEKEKRARESDRTIAELSKKYGFDTVLPWERKHRWRYKEKKASPEEEKRIADSVKGVIERWNKK